MKNLLFLTTILLGINSCTTDEKEVIPLYDVTFTGLLEPSITTMRVSDAFSSTQLHLNLSTGTEYAQGNYFSWDPIPDDITINNIEAGEYLATFNNGYNAYLYSFNSSSGYPILKGEATITVPSDEPVEIVMKNISGKITTSLKEGITLPADYKSYRIEYRTSYSGDYYFNALGGRPTFESWTVTAYPDMDTYRLPSTVVPERLIIEYNNKLSDYIDLSAEGVSLMANTHINFIVDMGVTSSGRSFSLTWEEIEWNVVDVIVK